MSDTDFILGAAYGAFMVALDVWLWPDMSPFQHAACLSFGLCLGKILVMHLGARRSDA